MTIYDQTVLVVANALANRLQYERRQEPLQGWDYANKVLEIVLDHYERETGLTAFDLMDDAYNLITGRAEGVSGMTVTNDRRREVARNLREHGLYESLMPLDKYLAWMYDVLDCGRSVTSLTMRLADLIEPEPERTCRVVTDKNTVSQTQEVHTKYCSECSYVFGREQHRPLLPGLDEEFVLHAVQIPNYCPNCGAKVTEVDE